MKGIFFAIIAFVVSTILIPLFIMTSCDLSIPYRDKPKNQEQQTVESDLVIPVYNHKTEEIMEMSLEEYIAGVVAAEAPGSFELEALKAQAVAARTYALWRRMLHGEEGHPSHPGAVVCTSHIHCQEWLSKDELRDRHGRRWVYDYWPKIEEAVNSTRGVIMTYNMQPIEPLYHSTSGGATENAEDVFANAKPYLKSVSSPYEERSPVLVDTKEVVIKDFIAAMKKKDREVQLQEKNILSQIRILERSDGGRILKIQVGNKTFTGREIREIFGLRSADFTLSTSGNKLIFTTKGYGHGVGMSQWGANGMAERGHSYEEILKHYYQGVSLSRLRSYRQ